MQDQSPAQVVTLGPVLDVRAATPLHRELSDLRGQPIVVNAQGVERIGGQCAAVLLSAARSWRGDGQDFELTEASEGFEEGWQLLGLDMAELRKDEPAFAFDFAASE
ncbi:STAS domain-containing protein [Aureimonas sp. ME7]|uniref:STAS domain-containing protein n=1 Tax=Aureimonas sp. ME7 TaxID=2744252 RepID=UPI0015F5E5B5|nr:STAS domain-containing protein [Aureimonas sp. ME7]